MVRQVQIIDRGSGAVIEQRLEQAHTAIKVTRPSTIRIAMSKEAVVGWEREQGDLVIRFADGTSLRIEGYFDCTPDLSNELIFAEPDGELWRATVTTAEGEVCLAETAGSDVLSATFERSKARRRGGSRRCMCSAVWRRWVRPRRWPTAAARRSRHRRPRR
jgi:hypothetical protein